MCFSVESFSITTLLVDIDFVVGHHRFFSLSNLGWIIQKIPVAWLTSVLTTEYNRTLLSHISPFITSWIIIEDKCWIVSWILAETLDIILVQPDVDYRLSTMTATPWHIGIPLKNFQKPHHSIQHTVIVYKHFHNKDKNKSKNSASINQKQPAVKS